MFLLLGSSLVCVVSLQNRCDFGRWVVSILFVKVIREKEIFTKCLGNDQKEGGGGAIEIPSHASIQPHQITKVLES